MIGLILSKNIFGFYKKKHSLYNLRVGLRIS